MVRRRRVGRAWDHGRVSSSTVEQQQGSVIWQPQGPFDLLRTLSILPRGMGDRSILLEPGQAWLAFVTADGPVTLRLQQLPRPADATASARDIDTDTAAPPRNGPGILAQAWGPGAAAALSGVPALLGEADDWSGFDAADFSATLPRFVREARRRNLAVRLPSTGRVLDALVPVVLEQKVTLVEAHRAYRYLLREYGTSAPASGPEGPAPAGLLVPPTAEQWSRIPSWEWHSAGVGPQRSDTIMRLLRSATALERLSTVPAAEAAAKLQAVPGIGPWTAAEVTQRTHGNPDNVSVGDYHLAAYVGWALAGRPVDDAGMLRLLEPWRGHRQRVVRMLHLSGFRKPRFGARMTIQDHRRH
jgi:3-methyladenine DNA glycosylase/8-oxoguanine DNA glycosylase